MKTYSEYLEEYKKHYTARDGTVHLELASIDAKEKFFNDLAQAVSDIQEVIEMTHRNGVSKNEDGYCNCKVCVAP